MSDALRIAAVVEGPTDRIVLQAIVRALLPATDFEFQTLQPEGSLAFQPLQVAGTGVGWVGVYRWSRQSAQEGGGSVSGSFALLNHDVLIVHVDADVANKTYGSGNIQDAPQDDLPCEEPCPPVSATTNALRAVILNWLGEGECPPQIILCTPSKNIETWVLAAVCPIHGLVPSEDWECRHNPEGQLATLPLMHRFQKSQNDYESKQDEITDTWPTVSARLEEAKRFEEEFLAAVPDDSGS